MREGDAGSQTRGQRQGKPEEAANRALWAVGIERALRDLHEGRVLSWDEVAADLRRELGR